MLTYKKKVIRSCLSPERASDTSDQKTRKRRSVRRKRNRLRKEYEKSKVNTVSLKGGARPTQSHSNKKLKVIHLQPMPSNINPIHTIRFMDYLFPLDSNFKSLTIKPSNFQPIWGDLRYIKRISSIQRDLNMGTWTYFLEEKFPQKPKLFRGEEQFGYFKEW